MWTTIDKLKDSDKIASGCILRFYNKEEAIAHLSSLPTEPMDYLIHEVYSNNDIFQVTCLTPGEEGNILSVLNRTGNYTTGKELKRMFQSNLYEVLLGKDVIISLTVKE